MGCQCSKPAGDFSEVVKAGADGFIPANVLSTTKHMQPSDSANSFQPAPEGNCHFLTESWNYKMHPTNPESRFDDITKLMASIFNVPISVVALVDNQSCYFKSCNYPPFNPPPFDKRLAFCSWTHIPLNPEVLVFEDTLLDARTCESSWVTAGPKLRFYAAAPLVTSTGVRLGTLCVCDFAPHKFDASCCAILCNFAEMVVREIEADSALQHQRQLTAQMTEDNRKLQQAVAAGTAGVVLVDVESPEWPILFCNPVWARVSGVAAENNVGKAFWNVYMTPGESQSSAPCEAYQHAIEAGEMFRMDVVVSGGNGKHCFTVTFKPASRGNLDAATSQILIPPLEGADDQQLGRYWFGTVRATSFNSGSGSSGESSSLRDSNSGGNTTASSSSSIDPRATGACPFPDVRVGPLLGRGSFGSVFRGSWSGSAVAIKVVEHRLSQQGVEEADKALEGMLGMKLLHPNIVRAFKYTIAPREVPVWKRPTSDDGALSVDALKPLAEDKQVDSRSSAHSLEAARVREGTGSLPRSQWIMETWIVLELCNRGNLQSIIDKGVFRSQRSVIAGGVNLVWVMLTAAEIASAMAYLHSQDILHGDLNGSNVLLVANAGADSRPFSAKVSDFGLSRILIGQEAVKTVSFGTVTHMPPELLREGRLSKAADVYAFGVLLWSMYIGQRPWGELRHVQIIAQKMMGKTSALEFPESTPKAYKALAEACMDPDDKKRPTFAQVVAQLKPIHEAVEFGEMVIPDFPVYSGDAVFGRPPCIFRPNSV
ncbi:hypothetical protein WJX72_006916 [[Myrmecia] bisecta]|uniref:Protein kinase domain-containing protein n=1 Tax=[Myrmecia] bisecta TaxID=41462 RepID=A0AAW1PQB9_9CHLO